MQEHHFYCPHCHAGNVVIIDAKAKSKEIVADCDICAHPVLLNYNFDPNKRIEFTADFAANQLTLA